MMMSEVEYGGGRFGSVGGPLGDLVFDVCPDVQKICYRWEVVERRWVQRLQS